MTHAANTAKPPIPIHMVSLGRWLPYMEDAFANRRSDASQSHIKDTCESVQGTDSLDEALANPNINVVLFSVPTCDAVEFFTPYAEIFAERKILVLVDEETKAALPHALTANIRISLHDPVFEIPSALARRLEDLIRDISPQRIN